MSYPLTSHSSQSRIVISPGGCFIGDLSGFHSVYIDGKVVGDVNVENLYLGSSASVHGDISCKTIQIDGGAALVGKLEISPHALVTSDYDENKSIIEGDIEVEEEFPITDEEVASPRGELFQEDENDQESYHSPVKPAPRREYRVVLFIMEPQVDFYPGGKCGARGASNDTEKAEILADFIHSHLDDIDEIVVSLDSHNVSSFCFTTDIWWFLSHHNLIVTNRIITYSLQMMVLPFAAHTRGTQGVLGRQERQFSVY